MPRRPKLVSHPLTVSAAATRVLWERASLDDAIRSAIEAGHSLREVAMAAGISHQQVWRILRR